MKGGDEMKLTFDYSKLRGRVIEKYGTCSKFASALGVDHKTVSMFLNRKRVFKDTEIVEWITLLDLKRSEIPAYFFAFVVEE